MHFRSRKPKPERERGVGGWVIPGPSLRRATAIRRDQPGAARNMGEATGSPVAAAVLAEDGDRLVGKPAARNSRDVSQAL